MSRPKVHFSMDFCLLTMRRGTEERGAYKNRGRKPLAFRMLDGQKVAISETPVTDGIDGCAVVCGVEQIRERPRRNVLNARAWSGL